MEPVQDVVDLLALHLGVDTVGEEPVAGLTHTHTQTDTQTITHAASQQQHNSVSSGLRGAAHLVLHLHDALLRQGARLDHRDAVSRQVGEDFLTEPRQNFNTC